MSAIFSVALLDFDGTLVSRDILDLLCREMGKEHESAELNAAFRRGELVGLDALVARINLLRGMTLDRICQVLLTHDVLMPGVQQLIDYFRDKGVITILASGNIMPVLEHYQRLLGIDHIVGSQPTIKDGVIVGIDKFAYTSPSFKVDGIKQILDRLQLDHPQIVAIGDSPADVAMFELSDYSIAINPKGDTAEIADAVIEDDLAKAIPLLESLE